MVEDMWNPKKYALKPLFKDGRLILPQDRPEIQKQVQDSLMEKRRISAEKGFRTKQEKLLSRIQNAKKLLYVEVAFGNDDIMEQIFNYMRNHNIPTYSEGDTSSTRWFQNGSIPTEFVIDELTDKQVVALYSFLHKYDKNKVKYDVYER